MTGITPAKFDALVQPPGGERVIWTALAIARRINVSADWVRDVLAKEPGTPVRMINGRYSALESELIDFFRSRRRE